MIELIQLKSPVKQKVQVSTAIASMHQQRNSAVTLNKEFKSVPYFTVNKLSQIGPVYYY